MKRKLLSVLLALVLALSFSLMTAMPVAAKGPVGETVTISWFEDGTRHYPDGSAWGIAWTNDPLGPADLVRTGKAYHFADIGDFYNQELPDVSGKVVISGGGQLSGHATYTSQVSFLPIKERFRGQVTIDAGTMVGTYTQWAYAFGAKDEVLDSYPGAIPANKQGAGWWFIGYTEYIAH